ncbi:hypothetical protein LINPERHAP2_LOCUS29947 [Linum perenne]
MPSFAILCGVVPLLSLKSTYLLGIGFAGLMTKEDWDSERLKNLIKLNS